MKKIFFSVVTFLFAFPFVSLAHTSEEGGFNHMMGDWGFGGTMGGWMWIWMGFSWIVAVLLIVLLVVVIMKLLKK